jgi:hypothetical protein
MGTIPLDILYTVKKKTTFCKPCKDFVMPAIGRNFASSNLKTASYE